MALTLHAQGSLSVTIAELTTQVVDMKVEIEKSKLTGITAKDKADLKSRATQLAVKISQLRLSQLQKGQPNINALPTKLPDFKSIIAIPKPPPVTSVTFRVTPSTINTGAVARFSWSTSNVTKCLNNWNSSVMVDVSTTIANTSGTEDIYVPSSRTFRLTCLDASGKLIAKSVYVRVLIPPPPTTIASPIVCLSGYTCTPVGASLPVCPFGYSCSIVTAGCPSGYTCTITTQTREATILVVPGSTRTLSNPVVPPPPTVDLKVGTSDGPMSIAYGNSFTLTWTSTNASVCVKSGGWSGSAGTSGSQMLTIFTTTTYTLTCSNTANIQSSDSMMVALQTTQPSVTISTISSLFPTFGITGSSVTVSGTGFNSQSMIYLGTQMVIPTNITSTSMSFSVPSVLNLGTYYVYSVNGTTYSSAGPTFTVTAPVPPPPTVDLKVGTSDGPMSIAYGNSFTLTWTSTNASSCVKSGGWSGTAGTSGSVEIGDIHTTTTYTITCSNITTATAADSVTVNVGSGVTSRQTSQMASVLNDIIRFLFSWVQ